jgi:hypothetical protein
VLDTAGALVDQDLHRVGAGDGGGELAMRAARHDAALGGALRGCIRDAGAGVRLDCLGERDHHMPSHRASIWRLNGVTITV